ncbi:hypothetical protein TRFO_36041 [Tritrichomonas foetus]|uniref:Uncharacterized protein n=1 Tax=Tritrichomonas foetus TaxID=1144522 RepID=A0A1J4JF44_9EUKA|nr:hypothetical protein TRFO_36041 [Tritrichomonas foetus]|eukprot:OHS97712.1 hypothetical protein TRFO_36041 [Tritrichomonas foetus]
MFQISTTTTLFGEIPPAKFAEADSDSKNDYQEEIVQKYKLAPAPRKAPVVEEAAETEEIGQPKKVDIEGPKRHREILKGSTGSKIFSMLQNMKPSTRVQKDNAPKVKTADSAPPKRKLAFSK